MMKMTPAINRLSFSSLIQLLEILCLYSRFSHKHNEKINKKKNEEIFIEQSSKTM